ncbi:MAG: helix-turn-helix domain-containing protein [Polyangiaceae bacterium]
MTQRAEMARRFIAAFSDTYRALHRSVASKWAPLTPQGRAVLLHLEWAGPMTIGDLAKHCERAQSVVSETCDVLTAHGMIREGAGSEGQATNAGVALSRGTELSCRRARTTRIERGSKRRLPQ